MTQMANYTLTIDADSGYQSTTEGRCTAEQYGHAIAALHGETPSIKSTMEWQPIETAPEETEVFIGAFIDGVFKFGRSEMFYEQANEFAGETWSGWVWSIDYCDDSVAENPTHWMPLPAPPQKEAP